MLLEIVMVAVPLAILGWVIRNHQFVWPATQSQRWAAQIFGAVWLIIWVLLWRGVIAETGAVALRFWDESLPQLVLVVVASVLVGWWRMSAGARWSEADIYGSLKGGLLAALLIGEVNALLVVAGIVDAAVRGGYVDWLWGPWPMGRAMVEALDLAVLRGLVIGPIGGLTGAVLAYIVHGWRGLRRSPASADERERSQTMPMAEAGERHRGWLLVLRCALFALGLNFILDSLRTGAFRELLDARALADVNLLGILVGIIISGVGAGVLLLILGLVAGPVSRHRSGWVVLGLTMLGAMAPFAGFGLIFGPGGGDQGTALGGLGFLLILLGTPIFFGAYVWAVVLAISVINKDRRNPHSRGGPAAPSGVT